MSHQNVQPHVNLHDLDFYSSLPTPSGHWLGAPTPLLRGPVHLISALELFNKKTKRVVMIALRFAYIIVFPSL